jgi:hypothetical protein
MNIQTKLSDYTEEEKKTFDAMHQVLVEYNAQLSAGTHAEIPAYSDEDMAAYSRYREILLTDLARRA